MAQSLPRDDEGSAAGKKASSGEAGSERMGSPEAGATSNLLEVILPNEYDVYDGAKSERFEPTKRQRTTNTEYL